MQCNPPEKGQRAKARSRRRENGWTFATRSRIWHHKGLNTATARLVTGPIAFFAVVIIGCVTGRGHHATVSGILVLRIITALVVVLHCPIVIIDALLINVLIATPAHLLTIRTLADADHTLGRGRRCEDIVNRWTTAGKQEFRQKNDPPSQGGNELSLHQGLNPLWG
jgi:hypothetical protein